MLLIPHTITCTHCPCHYWAHDLSSSTAEQHNRNSSSCN